MKYWCDHNKILDTSRQRSIYRITRGGVVHRYIKAEAGRSRKTAAWTISLNDFFVKLERLYTAGVMLRIYLLQTIAVEQKNIYTTELLALSTSNLHVIYLFNKS